MGDLKWRLENGTYNALAVRHAAGEFRGPMARYADTADLIACLKANPEACEEVLQGLDSAYSLREWDAMREDRDQFQRRAEQAERALADLAALIHTESGLDDHRYTAEQMVTEMASGWEHESAGREQAERSRDEWRAKWEDLETHRAVCCDQMERERDALTEERDALKAKLAEARREAAQEALRIVAGMRSEVDAAKAHLAWRAAGSKGMSVPFHGDFAGVPTSALHRLEWWLHELDRALADEVSRG